MKPSQRAYKASSLDVQCLHDRLAGNIVMPLLSILSVKACLLMDLVDTKTMSRVIAATPDGRVQWSDGER